MDLERPSRPQEPAFSPSTLPPLALEAVQLGRPTAAVDSLNPQLAEPEAGSSAIMAEPIEDGGSANVNPANVEPANAEPAKGSRPLEREASGGVALPDRRFEDGEGASAKTSEAVPAAIGSRDQPAVQADNTGKTEHGSAHGKHTQPITMLPQGGPTISIVMQEDSQ